MFFAQAHRPGEAAQTDFTHGTELGVTILGVAFAHLLCHFVLPYSNWEWVTVCMSESIAAIRRGVPSAIFRLGHHPIWHQTDNSTAATHELGDGDRDFNREYASMIAHFGMKPRTIKVGDKEQNGDVEAANGALKRRIAQRLLVRGSSDFESVEAYERWLADDPVARGNAGRRTRLAEELAVMPAVRVERLPEFKELDVGVTSWSTIRVDHNAYSVPSRMIGQRLRVRLYERRIELYLAQQKQFELERLRGRNGHRINYRHVIWSLVQKPAAFARHKFREDFFPTLTFRRGVIITSNLVFSQWDRIFKDAMTTAAAIDRLVHHSIILELVSKRSFRADATMRRYSRSHQESTQTRPSNVNRVGRSSCRRVGTSS